MKRKELYISPLAYPETVRHIRDMGYSISFTEENPVVHPAIAAHPDVFYCRMGASEKSEVITWEIAEPRAAGKEIAEPRATGKEIAEPRVAAEEAAESRATAKETAGGVLKYPEDCRYNAACTGRYLIHRLDITAPEIIDFAQKNDMIMIDVPQGYAKCSTVVVDETSIITYDRGIAKACSNIAADLDILLIESGHVSLPGMGEAVADTTRSMTGRSDDMSSPGSNGIGQGFIGGASGRVGREVIFNGDLSAHPDFPRIKAFIEEKGLECYWIPDRPLLDIGSIV